MLVPNGSAGVRGGDAESRRRYIYIYIYIYIGMCVYIYIYIHYTSKGVPKARPAPPSGQGTS